MRVMRFAAVLAFCTMAVPAGAEDTAVGFVKVLSGTASVIRDRQRGPLALGMEIREHDQLETETYSELGVTFRDDTRISLGPNTRIDISQFTFRPADRKYGIAFKLLVGTLQYVSGVIAKLSPESVSISTPQFTVAVRGTRLLLRAEN